MRKRCAAALITVLFALGACSGPPGAGDRSLLGQETPQLKQKAKKQARRAAKKAKAAKKAAAKADAPAVAAEGGAAIGENVDVPGADEDKQYPNGSAEITEPNPDGQSQGITPGYAEMLGASIEGLGKNFRITLTFNGDIPQEMPNDKTVMVVGFQVLRGEDEGYAFAGQATNKGWKPYAGGKNKQTKFPGTFEVSGNTIVMTIPWSYIEGAYPFKWMSTSNWFQSLANTTHYIFDLIPNKGQANYPG